MALRTDFSSTVEMGSFRVYSLTRQKGRSLSITEHMCSNKFGCLSVECSSMSARKSSIVIPAASTNWLAVSRSSSFSDLGSWYTATKTGCRSQSALQRENLFSLLNGVEKLIWSISIEKASFVLHRTRNDDRQFHRHLQVQLSDSQKPLQLPYRRSSAFDVVRFTPDINFGRYPNDAVEELLL